MLLLYHTPKEVKRLLKVNNSVCGVKPTIDSDTLVHLLVDCTRLMKFEKIVLKILTPEQITVLEDTLVEKEVPILWTSKKTPKT